MKQDRRVVDSASFDARSGDNIRDAALKALREGRFDLATEAIETGQMRLEEAVENLKIYQAELEIQNEELRHSQLWTESALRRFTSLFASLPLPALVMDRMGIVLECNFAAERRFNLDSRQLKSHYFPRLVKKKEHARLRKLMDEALETSGSSGLSLEMQTSDGDSLIVDLHLALLPDLPASSPNLVAMIVDQTEAIKQRQALESSQLHFMAYFESAPIGMTASDTVKRNIEVNRRMAEMLGYSRDELLNMTWLELTHPDDARQALELFDRIMAGESDSDSIEMRMIRKDATFFPAHVAVHCVRAPSGSVDYFVAAIEDISERKRAEFARNVSLLCNSELLKLNREAESMGDRELLARVVALAEKSTSSRLAYAHFVGNDRQTIRLVSWSRPDYPTQFEADCSVDRCEAWQACLDEHKAVIRNDGSAIAHEAVGFGEPCRFARHLVVPVFDGDHIAMIVGVADKEEPYELADQTVIEMIANHAWALLQKNRSQRQLELASLAFKFSREAVFVTDADQKILSINEAFTRITGYEAEEALGRTPRLLKSHRHNAEFYREMWRQIQTQGYWQGEIVNRKKNGDIYSEWMSISEVTAPSGELTGYLAVFMDISEQKQAQERIQYLAHHDTLTGLPNRTLLRDRFELAVAYAKRQGTKVGVIYLDLDHFKNINDSLGHQIGDLLLVDVAHRLRNCVRDIDTVSRLGGDEFLLILNHIHNGDNIVEICSKIQQALLPSFRIEGSDLSVSCSVGACLYPDDGNDFDLLLKLADIALYQAKGDGRSNYKLFTPEMNLRVMRRQRLETDMRHALTNKGFYLEYQPQFENGSLRLLGVESLLRWRHPDLGPISPAEFIPIAEDCGLIVELGHWVMHQACAQAKQWYDRGLGLRVAVNVSYAQFVRNNLLQLVIDALRDSGLPPHCLELELTESILVADPENVLKIVKEIKALGVCFAIDDFGTGYSSLSYLKRFPVDKLKIDQSFIRDIPGDKEDEAIVTAIIGLAHSLQIESIAEGVETQQQIDFLIEHDCRQLQGYRLSRPLSAGQIESLLIEKKRQGLLAEV
ncbi:MAG: hypothetical protein Kow0065_22920 [Methylomicrobium sp.]